jgi:hypothetical protein
MLEMLKCRKRCPQTSSLRGNSLRLGVTADMHYQSQYRASGNEFVGNLKTLRANLIGFWGRRC